MEDRITGKIDIEQEFFERPLVDNFLNLMSYKLAIGKATQGDISLVLKNFSTSSCAATLIVSDFCCAMFRISTFLVSASLSIVSDVFRPFSLISAMTASSPMF